MLYWICWGLVAIVAANAAGVALVITALVLRCAGAAPNPPPHLPETRRRRGLVCACAAGLVAAFLFIPDFHTGNASLPVEEPQLPPTTACASDDDFGRGFGAEHSLFVRGSMVLVAFLLARRRGERAGVPTGKYVLPIAAGVAGLVLLACSIRYFIGGSFQAQQFDTFGAVTPAGARGPKVESILRYHIGDRSHLTDLKDGKDLASDVRTFHSSHEDEYSTRDWYEFERGVIAWVDSKPVLIDPPEIHAVSSRTVVSPKGRPHFRVRPRYATSRSGNYGLLVEDRPDGAVFAVLTEAGGTKVRGASRRDASALLRPPPIPLAVLAGAFALAVGVLVVSRKRDLPVPRYLAAWLLAEAVSWVAWDYYPFFF